MRTLIAALAGLSLLTVVALSSATQAQTPAPTCTARGCIDPTPTPTPTPCYTRGCDTPPIPPPSVLAAFDYDQDCVIDYDDVLILWQVINNWPVQLPLGAVVDVNGDGLVNDADLYRLVQYFGAPAC